MHFQKLIPMKGISCDSSQISFLKSDLSEQLNPRHPIYQLSKIIDWESLENDYPVFTAAEAVLLNRFF